MFKRHLGQVDLEVPVGECCNACSCFILVVSIVKRLLVSASMHVQACVCMHECTTFMDAVCGAAGCVHSQLDFWVKLHSSLLLPFYFGTLHLKF